jgi:hypothetical protein
LVQVTTLLRRANDLDYWQPEGYPAPNQSLTFAVRFFGPMQNGICNLSGSLACFINALIPFCPNWMARQLQAVAVWSLEIVIRLTEFIEGFISTFAGAPCASAANAKRVYGINLSCLTGAMISLFSFPTDAFLADGMISCRQDPCACYNDLYNDGTKFVNFTYSNAISGNVMGLDGRQPQPCVVLNRYIDSVSWFQTCCNGTAATYNVPTGGAVNGTKVCLAYNMTGDPIPECLPKCFPTVPNPCKYNNPALPLCDSIAGFLPMDGLFMAPLRYMRCLFQLAFGGGPLFDGLILAVSVVWQYTKPVINVIVGFFNLVLGLLIDSGGFFGFVNSFVNFFDSFSAIFGSPPIIPSTLTPLGRSNLQRTQSPFAKYGGFIQALNAVFGDYKFDCYTNSLDSCVCDNLPDVCNEHPQGARINFRLLNKKFEHGTTSCDVIARSINSVEKWSQMKNLATKTQYIDCLEKRIQGERVRDMLYPMFPPNMFYVGWSAIPALLNEYANKNRAAEDIPREHSGRAHERIIRIQQELQDREESVINKHFRSEGWRKAMVRLDAFEYKLRSGYYMDLLRIGVERQQRGETSNDKDEMTVGKFARITGHAAIEITELTWTHVPRLASTIFTSTRDMYALFSNYHELFKKLNQFKTKWLYEMANVPVSKELVEKRQLIVELFKRGPVYQWFNGSYYNENNDNDYPQRGTPWITIPAIKIVQHWYKVMLENRAQAKLHNAEPAFWNFYRMDTLIQNTKNHLYNRFFTAHWTPLQRDNYDRGKRVAYSVYDTIYPGHMTEKEYQRFILDGTCPIINDAVNLIVQTVTICANTANVNQNRTLQNVERIKRSNSPYYAQVYNITSRFGHLITNNLNTSNYKIWPPAVGNSMEHNVWLRPRNTNVKTPLPMHLNTSYMTRDHLKRIISPTGTATGFNLFTWLLDTLDSLFSWNNVGRLAQFFIDLKAWFLNPSINPQDYPNVGGIYWLTFPVRCEFPQNLDCSIGVGLGQALLDVLPIYGGLLLLSMIVFQSLTATLISGMILFIVFAGIIPAVAWHFSLRCVFLTPSVGLGLGVSVPFLPVPVTMAFPECLVSDIIATFDNVFSTCYTFWPPYMLVGNACPTCPQKFNFLNCLFDVGIGDGLSNVLWYGYQFLGSAFCNTIQTVFSFIPGAAGYFSGKCAAFASATPTQNSQFWWCSWATLPALFLPTFMIVVAATFVGFVLPSLIDLLIAIVRIVWIPLAFLLSGSGSYFPSNSSQTDEDDDDDNAPTPPSTVFQSAVKLSGDLIHWILVRPQMKKYKLKRE